MAYAHVSFSPATRSTTHPQSFEIHSVDRSLEHSTVPVEILHHEGLSLAHNHSCCEARMVEILAELHTRKAHLHFKCESLWQYTVSYWRLSEHAAKDMVTVAKKASEIPEMIAALYSRRATISKLRKICPVIEVRNAKSWLELVAECSTRTVERTVAMAKPEAMLTERVRYKSGSTIEITIDVTEELYLEMKRMQDLVCQQRQSHVSMATTFEHVVRLGLDKLDPVRKAQRAMKRVTIRKADSKASSASTACQDTHEVLAAQLIDVSSNSSRDESENPTAQMNFEQTAQEIPSEKSHEASHETSQTPLESNAYQGSSRTKPISCLRNRRRPISAGVRHTLNLRDEYQCSHVSPEGHRCAQRRWLQIHHVRLISEGGTNDVGNLRILCSFHHRLIHANPS